MGLAPGREGKAKKPVLPDSSFLVPPSCSVFFLPVKGLFFPMYAKKTYGLFPCVAGEWGKEGRTQMSSGGATQKTRALTRRARAKSRDVVAGAHAYKSSNTLARDIVCRARARSREGPARAGVCGRKRRDTHYLRKRTCRTRKQACFGRVHSLSQAADNSRRARRSFKKHGFAFPLSKPLIFSISVSRSLSCSITRPPTTTLAATLASFVQVV